MRHLFITFLVFLASVRGWSLKNKSNCTTAEDNNDSDSDTTENDPSSSHKVINHSEIFRTLADRIENFEEFLVQTRRSLHQIPELMYQEERTSNYIASVLDSLGVKYTRGWSVNTHPEVYDGPGGYGIVADIGTGQPPCVLLRADIDALPVYEETDNVDEFRSKHEGKMHACGHDGHTTMLLGAVAVLKQMEQDIKGTVRIIFQPAEEGGAGAKRMVEEGVLDMHPPVEHAFAMHLWPALPSGTIGGKAGPLLGAYERFEIKVTGVGGHAAMPEQTVDPIVASSAIVLSLQTLVARTLSPLEPGVVSVTMLSGGDAFNVIPAHVTMRGTIRALSTDTLLQLRSKVESLSRSVAEAHGCTISISYSPDYIPPTINDPDLWKITSAVAASLSVDGQFHQVEPTMGAEDFAFIADKVPSSFFLVGQGSSSSSSGNPPSDYGLHHPKFAIDESVLPRGSQLHVALALSSLDRLSSDVANQ